MRYAMPMACEPLAQAPDMVKLIPLRRNITDRFMDTVEFIDWNMAPEPTIAVSFSALMMSTDLITGSELQSFP